MRREQKKEGWCELRTMKWLRDNGRFEGEACRQENYQVVWVIRGSGLYDIDLLTYPVSDGTFFVVPPGAMHRLRCPEEPTGYVLSFDGTFLSLSAGVPGRVAYDPVLAECPKFMVLSPEERRIIDIMNQIVRECELHSEFQQEIVSRLLYILLLRLHRLYGPVIPGSPMCGSEQLVHCFRSEVDRNFITKRTVGEYARDLLVSPTYLSGMVRRVTGYPASYHIQQRFVLEAKRLAKYSGNSMKQIAYCLGFETSSHFSKYFRNMAGLNFSEFRNEQRAEL
jgi:AraC family transcriptional regulator, transcriptional activator of pobA